MKERANKAASGNGATALWFRAARHGRAVAEPFRSGLP